MLRVRHLESEAISQSEASSCRESAEAFSTLIGRFRDSSEASETGDSEWITRNRGVLDLATCQAQSVEDNQLRKRPALVSKLFWLRKLNSMFLFDGLFVLPTLPVPAWQLDLACLV